MNEYVLGPVDLLKWNVNEYTEKKNGLTYLSWAGAWGEALKADPAVNFKVEMFDGTPLMMVGGSFMVWVTVTMFGKPVTCMLPVLDYRNKPINTPNAFDVNTSIMRCLVKALAMHGLGLYIYAGEDIPESYVKDVKAVNDVNEVKEAKEEKKYRGVQVTEWSNDDESRRAFADAMIEYTSISKDVDGLTSYWMANQTQLESLKKTHLEFYKEVLEKFTNLKKSFLE